MDRKEKHVKENESVANRTEADQIARSMEARGKNQKNESTRKTNKLWLWLGVLFLIFILLYWLFSIGIFEDMLAVFNG